MKKPHAPAVRALLRANENGKTIKEIAEVVGIRPKTALRVLTNMPDAYVDRWILIHGSRGQYQGVWCVVEPPANCPYPTERYEIKRTYQTQWVAA